MAVEAISTGAAKTEEAVRTVYERSIEVMRRQWSTYDHEKVFWNSTWTVGIIGLGWVAVQLGKAIKNVTGLPGAVASAFGIGSIPFTDPRYEYASIVYYVEGPGKTEDLPAFFKGIVLPWGTVLIPNVYDAVMLYRQDAEGYAAYKTDWEADHPEYANFAAKIKSSLSMIPASPNDILVHIEKFYNEYGPIMPFAAVAGHMGLESLRVYRIRRNLKE